MNHYPFKQNPLPYELNGLEPAIDTKTMTIHRNPLELGYINKLNTLLKDYPYYHSWTLETILNNIQAFPQAIQTDVSYNAGGVYAHDLFFQSLQSGLEQTPTGELLQAITIYYEDYNSFKKQLIETGKSFTGSGWLWLVTDRLGKLKIFTLPNHQIPFTPLYQPILVIDLWEHAIFLKYINKKEEYLTQIFSVINWRIVEERFANFQSNCVYHCEKASIY